MEIDDIILNFEKNYGKIDNELDDDVAIIAEVIDDILNYLKERHNDTRRINQSFV